MIKGIVSSVCLFTITLSLAACSTPSGDIVPLLAVTDPNVIGFEDYESRRAVREQNPVEDGFLAALDDFSYKTVSAVLGSAADNANFSPLSLYYALALAGTGASGDTQTQIFNLLGVSDADELSVQCGNLYRLLYTDHEITKLKIANSLWLDRSTSFRNSFVQNAANQFYASSYSVDFTDRKTGEAMSRWMSDQTGGTLSPVFETHPEQILSIINTVYFYDEWMDRFNIADTAEDVFHAPKGDLKVDFMNRTYGSSGYVKGEGFIRSALGLKGSGQMIFILPDEGVGISELLSSKESVRTLFESGEQRSGEVVWQIPKFGFDSKYELADILKTLGVTDAFKENADFKGITDGTAYITDVTQQTHIAIDENGVEASAFTEIGYAGAAMPEGRAEMILDRPFIYAITSEQGSLLFAGIYSNPAG